jgi:hypothetical protein
VRAENKAWKAIAAVEALNEVAAAVLVLVAEAVGARLVCHGQTYEIGKWRNRNLAARF